MIRIIIQNLLHWQTHIELHKHSTRHRENYKQMIDDRTDGEIREIYRQTNGQSDMHRHTYRQTDRLAERKKE